MRHEYIAHIIRNSKVKNGPFFEQILNVLSYKKTIFIRIN
jgi:hypothetical protein